ncbi:hypothetical protein AVEN_13849-1 [Araneus ventricosus]|uniref:Uncharacterized protein n=1 Tax=Araneus ventricosus TaxID=182803 RepID=A0A4Y2NXW5_ARAVE|nr:hypothetical protein AVEN_13849-1 [Araneus ventricosus]
MTVAAIAREMSRNPNSHHRPWPLPLPLKVRTITGGETQSPPLLYPQDYGAPRWPPSSKVHLQDWIPPKNRSSIGLGAWQIRRFHSKYFRCCAKVWRGDAGPGIIPII